MPRNAACHGLVVCAQVDQAKGAVSAQMLLQLETEMLLNLMVRQLTASIPDSYPRAQAAREAVYQLHAAPFARLWHATSLHKLPRPAAYTGPQVALQLLPSPLQPLSLQQQQQREQQQEADEREEQGQQGQQVQPAEWCVLAPTAPLLAELLPLLTHQFLKKLQQHLEQQPPQAFLDEPLGQLCYNLQCMANLLLICMVPAMCTTAAAEGPPPAAAKATEAMAVEARLSSSPVPYACVLHAQDAFMRHCGDL